MHRHHRSRVSLLLALCAVSCGEARRDGPHVPNGPELCVYRDRMQRAAEATRGPLDWGASCRDTAQCRQGLVCSEGTCEEPPSCCSNRECQVSCVDGYCDRQYADR